MTLKHVRMDLARDHEFPNGSREHGYEFVAPLDDAGYLVAAEWRKKRDRCRVKRYWGREQSQLGHLVHRPGGSWAFDYDPERSSDDEPGFKLDKHRFIPGEYVSIKESDGILRAFIVRTVADLD
ncbi:hypothetical protein [Hyphomicrobium sp.]|uniref:hypothetical protein n=1 Tax=Hyphomicrobium sp. TaxID=82 RepID=UPI0025C1F1A5|nr:hypothetical protein [Hyphomicrobium sp.]MCC7253858.1 hypothetical protein [Hyphomicrobium sp.]